MIIACFCLSAFPKANLRAAEFNPFVSIQIASPIALAKIAKAFGDVLDPDDTIGLAEQLQPLENSRGIDPDGIIGLALQVNENALFGLDVFFFLPVADISALRIPGQEMQIFALTAMLGAPANGKYTIRGTPLGTITAFQKQDIFLFATEGVAEFAESAEGDAFINTLKAEVDTGGVDTGGMETGAMETLVRVTFYPENISLADLRGILEKLAGPLAMAGMPIDPNGVMDFLADFQKQTGPSVVQQFEDSHQISFAISLDADTFDMSVAGFIMSKEGTELDREYSHTSRLKSQRNHVFSDLDRTVFHVSEFSYLTEGDIQMFSQTLDNISEGFLEGLAESFDGDEPQLARILQASELFQSHLKTCWNIVAESKLADYSYILDEDGTFIFVLATNHTDEWIEQDRRFYSSLLDIFFDQEDKSAFLDNVQWDFASVNGYSLSGMPRLFAYMPESMSVSGDTVQLLQNIPLSIYWAVKPDKAVVYAFGLDSAKADRALRDTLGKTPQFPSEPIISTFAIRPLGVLLHNQILPLIKIIQPDILESDYARMTEVVSDLAAVDADAKIMFITRHSAGSPRSGDGHTGVGYIAWQEYYINGPAIIALLKLLPGTMAQ